MRRIFCFIGFFVLLLSFALLFSFAGCTGKVNQQDDKKIFQIDSVSETGVQRMQASRSEQNIKMGNKNYHLFIQRIPADSLPHVKNDMGDTYVDNTITLRITRDKGEKVLSKTFTKHSFSSIVADNFLPQFILEGMVFDKTTPQGIVLAASLSVPQTDLYIPISITVASDGKMTIVKEDEIEETYTKERE